MVLVGDIVPQDAPFEVPNFGDELVLANLEGPVCRDGLKTIEKVGPHLHSLPFGLKGRWAFTLANNHFMDFQVDGMRESMAFLQENGFAFSGAGENGAAARKTLWLSDGGKKIAVICCCEHQFGVAGPDTAGVAAQGAWVESSICDARDNGANIVLVSSHAGSESTNIVSPRLQALYRHWIEVGADVIHGHHSHVPQGWESYKGKPIFYGLGNFIVKKADWLNNKNQLWSLVIHLDLSGDMMRWTVEPHGEVPLNYQEYIDDSNLIFAHADLMETRWHENAVRQYERYYKPFLEPSLKSLIYGVLHPRQARLVRLNFSRCENHIDIIRTAKGDRSNHDCDKAYRNNV